MKYTIMGFSQKKLIEFGLDLTDTLILRWFVDFKDTNKMYSEIVRNDKFYWIKYEALLLDIPILNIKKVALGRRLKNLSEKKILKQYIKKIGGVYTMYALDERYVDLIDFKEGSALQSTEVCTSKYRGSALQSTEGINFKVQTKNPSTKETTLLKKEEEEQKTSSSAIADTFEEKALAELERAKFKNINKNTVKNIQKYTNSFKELINAIIYIENTKKAKDIAILIALLRDKDYEIILEEKNTHKKKEQNRALFKNNEIKTIEIKETKEEKELREKKEKLSTIIMNLVLSMPRRLKLAEELTFINNIQNFNLFLLKIEKLKAELETKETV